MGAVQAKHGSLSLEQARNRFAKAEWAELSASYGTLADLNGRLTFRMFREHVLGTYFVPSFVAYRLFTALGGVKDRNRIYIEKEDFLRGLAVLLRGSREEKLELAFAVYDQNNNGSLSEEDILVTLRLLQTSSLRENLNKAGSHTRLCGRILNAAGKMQGGYTNSITLDVFKWLNGDSHFPAFSTWLIDLDGPGDCKSPFAQDEKTKKLADKLVWLRQRSVIAKDGSQMLFAERELSTLETQYYSILSTSNEGEVSPSGVGRRAFPRVPEALYEPLLKGFSDNKSAISISAFVLGVHRCTREGRKGKLEFLILSAGKKCLKSCTGEEMYELLEVLHKAHKSLKESKKEMKTMMTKENFISEWGSDELKPSDLNPKICKEIFRVSSWFFRDFERFAGIGLGIRPGGRDSERRVAISETLEEISDGLSFGDTLYVISSKWARLWADSVGMKLSDIHAPFWRITEKMKELKDEKSDDKKIEVHRIDNSSILEVGSISTLKSGLVELKDYIAVTPKLWAALISWYGGGPMIPRLYLRKSPVVSASNVRKSQEIKHSKQRISGSLPGEVELYPWRMTCRSVDRTQTAEVVMSRSSSLQTLKARICEKLDLQSHRVRLWSFHKPQGAHMAMPVMLESELTLESAGLRHGQEIVIEQQGKANRWEGVPEFAEETRKAQEEHKKAEKKSLATSQTAGPVNNVGNPQRVRRVSSGRVRSRQNSAASTSTTRARRKTRPFILGCAGMFNLGNTCFLNAALQCLAATPHLTRYFAYNLHLKELNVDNPLGANGELALHYAILLNQLRKSTMTSLSSHLQSLSNHMHTSSSKNVQLQATTVYGDPVAPAKIRSVIAKKYPQFSSYQQQDAQEFLSLLMDGLHEDLNRVLKKPYIQITDSNGRADAVVALEHIKGFLMRNQSVIIDLFCGFTKSTLEWEYSEETEEEKNEGDPPKRETKRLSSVKFEPFTMLSLPLPTRTSFTVNVTLAFQNPARYPLRLSVQVPIDGSLSDLRNAISNTPGVDIAPSQLFICEVHEGRVYPPLTEWERYEPNAKPQENQEEHDILVAYEVPKFQMDNEEDEDEDEGEGHDVRDDVKIHLDARLDVMDRYGKWYCATIIDWNPDTLMMRVTFDGFDSRYDENVHAKSDRIASLGSKASSIRSLRDGLNLPVDVIQVVCMHRRLTHLPKNKCILNKVRAKIWSLPIVLFVDKDITAAELYFKVWESTWKFAPRPTPRPIAPFSLRLVDNRGVACMYSPWDAYSFGKIIQISEHPAEIPDNVHIAIDWNNEYACEWLNERTMGCADIHASRKRALLEHRKHLDIGRCFKQFTEREHIKEVYCSPAKLHLPATKRIELYCLPPILVIHLKRLVQGGKIQTFVEFPIKGFDPSHYLTLSAKTGSMSVQRCMHEIENKRQKHKRKDFNLRSPTIPAPGPPQMGNTGKNGDPSLPQMRPELRGRTQSDPVDKKKKESSEKLYDLFGVINHYGGAGGGHYVAVAQIDRDLRTSGTGTGDKKGTKAWYRFDDSAVTCLSEDDVVTRNAYMMFYRRRDMEPFRWNFLSKHVQDLLRRPLTTDEKKLAEQAAVSAARAAGWGCSIS